LRRALAFNVDCHWPSKIVLVEQGCMNRLGDLNAPSGAMALLSARHVYSVAPNVKNKFAFANDAHPDGSCMYADTDCKLRSTRRPDLSCFIQHLERGFSHPVQMFGNSVRYPPTAI
jgi:hypothetical protein